MAMWQMCCKHDNGDMVDLKERQAETAEDAMKRSFSNSSWHLLRIAKNAFYLCWQFKFDKSPLTVYVWENKSARV